MEHVTPLAEWPDYWRRREPAREAVFDVATGRRWLYGELADAVDVVTGWLGAQSIVAGDRLAVLAQNRVETLLLMFACARLGAILVPLNYRLAPTEMASILANAEPVCLLHDEPFADAARAIAGDVPCMPLQSLLAGGTPSLAPGPLDPESPVLMLYTSGTTGQPKGALLSQRMVLWNAINTTVSWDLSGTDCAIIHTPFFHTGGLHVLTTPLLLRGGRLVILPAFDPLTVLGLIESERVSILFAVPTMFQMLCDQPTFASTDFTSLRYCISGGAPCPLSLIEAWRARGVTFKQGYGLTEAGPNCFTLPAQDSVRKAGSVGFPNFATRARIVDTMGQDVPPGEIGELWLGGPTLCSGYWRNAEATSELFEDGWLKTGDLFQFDGEGYAWIVDRKKDMYISGGENVYPAEVEAALLLYPDIVEAAVIGRPDPTWGEVGEAHLVLQSGCEWDEPKARAFLEARLARYKLPKAFVLRAVLPRTPTGKIQKNKLKG